MTNKLASQNLEVPPLVFVVGLPFVRLMDVCSFMYCNANASVVCAIMVTDLHMVMLLLEVSFCSVTRCIDVVPHCDNVQR